MKNHLLVLVLCSGVCVGADIQKSTTSLGEALPTFTAVEASPVPTPESTPTSSGTPTPVANAEELTGGQECTVDPVQGLMCGGTSTCPVLSALGRSNLPYNHDIGQDHNGSAAKSAAISDALARLRAQCAGTYGGFGQLGEPVLGLNGYGLTPLGPRTKNTTSVWGFANVSAECCFNPTANPI